MNIRAFGRLLFSGFGLPKLTFRESNFPPEPKPKSLFEALRSKRFVRRMGVGLVLVMGSTFAALQANAVDPGADSVVDNYLQVNVGGPTSQSATHPETGYLTNQANVTWEAWIYPVNDTLNRQAIFSKEGNFVLGLDRGRNPLNLSLNRPIQGVYPSLGLFVEAYHCCVINFEAFA